MPRKGIKEQEIPSLHLGTIAQAILDQTLAIATSLIGLHATTLQPKQYVQAEMTKNKLQSQPEQLLASQIGRITHLLGLVSQLQLHLRGKTEAQTAQRLMFQGHHQAVQAVQVLLLLDQVRAVVQVVLEVLADRAVQAETTIQGHVSKQQYLAKGLAGKQ
jgi:hypothetical protein